MGIKKKWVPGCGCCGTGTCECSDTSTIPDELSVSITGITNGVYGPSSCCTNLNGTFVVTKTGTFAWQYRRSSPCDCTEESDEDVLDVWVDEECYLHVRWTVNGFSWAACGGTCTQFWDLSGNYLYSVNNCGHGCDCIEPQTCPAPGYITQWDYNCLEYCVSSDTCYWGWRYEILIDNCMVDFDSIVDTGIFEGDCDTISSVGCLFSGGTVVSITAL